MNRLFRDRSAPPTPKQILDAVGDLAETAAYCFGKTRELNPDDNHGYITHIQLILSITERLMRASGGQTIALAKALPLPVQSWLERNLVIAEDLLQHVQHMRAESRPSRFEINCVSRLQTLYGNFEVLIESWRRLLDSDESNDDLRRALSVAHYARGGRIWSNVGLTELREVVELMKANLGDDPANERDLRMWVSAYRRLPEFSYLEALGRLEAWRLERIRSMHTTTCTFQYLQWKDGLNPNEDAILEHLEHCQRLFVGRRGLSYEWLGKEPDWCPVVHHNELGEFDSKAGLFPRTELLQMVTGTIESMKGRQAGTIRLGPAMRAFFVPRGDLWESTDVNATVHFYLGFSYEGFRAWSVNLGPAPGAGGRAARLNSAARYGVMTQGRPSNLAGGKPTADVVVQPGEDSESLRQRVLQAFERCWQRQAPKLDLFWLPRSALNWHRSFQASPYTSVSGSNV